VRKFKNQSFEIFQVLTPRGFAAIHMKSPALSQVAFDLRSTTCTQLKQLTDNQGDAKFDMLGFALNSFTLYKVSDIKLVWIPPWNHNIEYLKKDR
jgi:hypothetical protein